MKRGKVKLATIIHYSSLDNEFIEFTIKEALKFSDVYVLSYRKFFNGEQDANLKIIKTERVEQRYLKFNPEKDGWWHHNNLRKKGFELAESLGGYKSYFFIDGDEVPDGDLVRKWLEDYDKNEDYKICCYWYYRDTCYQANQFEDSIALVSRSTLKDLDFFLPGDRNSLSHKYNRFTSISGQPMFHHYSWAKPKKALYDKIALFAHKDDMDWKSILDQEFNRPFNYICPFNGYSFKKVTPFIKKTFND